ncbi:MAG: phosphate signaling complex protein PhoU [Erysipelotrichaceae bacterium]|nr:phosphate signaling complex protein PhoU [Erysipelotrichaceae bacterium]
MRNRFDEQLDLLHEKLIRMSNMCEEVIIMAVKSLNDDDPELIKKVRETDPLIDNMEREIESLCFKLMLQQQPVAHDLRQISAALKMITDMERIGDQASDIVEIVDSMKGRPTIDCEIIRRMAEAVIEMVNGSVEAFVDNDVKLAQDVIDSDDAVDAYFDQAKEDLINMLKKDHADGEYAIDLLMIAKYFERIGDHATNIAEWVMFSVTGVHRNSEMMGNM